MKNFKFILLIIILTSNLLLSYTRVYVTVGGAGAMDGTSWSNAYPGNLLEHAMDDGLNEVWVAKGVYKPVTSTNNREKYFWITCVRVYGGFEGFELNLWQRNLKENETIFG